MFVPTSTFSGHLDALAARCPEASLLIDQDQRISAAQLRAQSRALAAGFARIGVRPGHRVAVWLPNCAAWVESFLACAHLGAVVLAVNTRFRALEVADILGRGQADWLVRGGADRGGRRRPGRRPRHTGAPLCGPAGRRHPAARPARQRRRAVLHHIGHHVQTQVRPA
ncbi:hypothetical protein G6F35_015207 [Rhizopus arrhizus]|nr:hypothetical protein G6F35_015207 [Rhizopus arrhizus]